MTDKELVSVQDESLDDVFIDPRRYLESLVKEAASRGLFDEICMLRLQQNLYDLLAALQFRLYRGKNSSCRVEFVESLLASASFVISCELKAQPTASLSLAALQNTAIDTLFENGVKRIKRKILVAKHMHNRLCKNLFETPNVFYRETITGGISGFFKTYNVRYAAHSVGIIADYPVLLGRPDADGIEFIEQYLARLEAENTFLNLFDRDEVHHVLYESIPDLAGTPANLFEPILERVTLCALLGKEPHTLSLTANERSDVRNIVHATERICLLKHCQAALERVLSVYSLSENAKEYAKLCLPQIVGTITKMIKG